MMHKVKIANLPLLLALLTLAVFSSPASAQNVHPIKLPKENLQPFLEKHCVACHGPVKQKGQIRLDKGPWLIDNNDTAQRWQDVLDQLNSGDMPPVDEDQPSQKELITILDKLTGTLQTARERLNSHGGEIQMRRLNRREYRATIHQLFGLDVDPDTIPEDGDIQTFDTVGEEQFFNSSHFEKYLALGRRIAEQAIIHNSRPYKKSTINRIQPETQHNANLSKKVAEADRKKAIKDAGGDWKAMGFKEEGDMAILFKQWQSRVEQPRRYLNSPHTDKGVYIYYNSKNAKIYRRTDPRATYLLRIRAGLLQQDRQPVDPLRKLIHIQGAETTIATRQIHGTPQHPQTIELPVHNKLHSNILHLAVTENISKSAVKKIESHIKKLKKKNPTEANTYTPSSHIWVDWLEMEGPFYPKQRPLFEDILYPDTPTGGKNPYYNNNKATRELIAKLTHQAFRHQTPDLQYNDALYQHFLDLRKQGANYSASLGEVMAIILSSPSFLFIQEEAPASDTPHPELTNRELAIRLSYFLWSSPPDAQLYAADLSDPRILSQQVDRMLISPRSRAFTDGFIQQWAELDRFDAITVDPDEYYRFNTGIQHDAKQEVREYFRTLVNENLPADRLISSDFIIANANLAAHYGIPYPRLKSPLTEFQKIPLAPHSPRGGLLTQAAFLITGSNGERSSPVIRGALVMEKILHDKPAPPPPNVPELGSSTDKPLSNRQLVIMHQKQAVCASCHHKMDPIGFGLENFDPIGRWRDTEKVGKQDLLIIPDGTIYQQKFKNVQQLKDILLTQKDHLAAELAESILTYALGRRTEFSDQDAIQAILKKTKQKNYPIQDLIKQIALSPLFRKP